MQKVRINKDKSFNINKIERYSENIIRITFDGEIPEEFGDIEVLTSGDTICAELAGFSTIFSRNDSEILLSNNGSVYKELGNVTTEPELGEEEKAKIELENKIKELNNQIADYKEQISSKDYMIIRCMEAKLLDKEMPYSKEDLESLHSARESNRSNINKLEHELSELIRNGKH